jgi:hypothetical protein
MKEYIFVPKECTEQDIDGVIVPASFDGSITLRIPSYPERQEFRGIALSLLNLSDEMKASQSVKKIVEMVEKSKQFYIAVDLKHKDGSEFKSFEDLSFDPRCESIMQDIAMEISKGMVPSKN